MAKPAMPIPKARDNRSAEKRDETFHAYDITPASARTAVLLLNSPEAEIICQTLRAISKFQAQDMMNRTIMLDLDTINLVLPHIEHPELNIRRFAYKVLAQLCQLPRGPELILDDTENIAKIIRAMIKTEDAYVLEFASLVLVELTREPAGCLAVVNDGSAMLFNRLRTAEDPDLQHNCLQILINLLSNPLSARVITNFIQFPPVLALMANDFPAIQIAALTALDLILKRTKDEVIEQFRKSTGLVDLFSILESYEWRDMHRRVLVLLRDYMVTEESAGHVISAGYVLTLLAYLEHCLPPVKPDCLSTLTRLSSHPNGRQALYEAQGDLEFCRQLSSPVPELCADAAYGVTNMTKLLISAVRMSDNRVIEILCFILCDEGAPWFDVRLNCLHALVELCRIVPKAAYALVEPKTFSQLRNVNKKPKDSPLEAQRLAIQCVINLQNYEDSKGAVITKDFIQELVDILANREDIPLKMLTCEALCGLMSEPHGRALLCACGGAAAVRANLRIESVSLRTAVCRLVAASVTERTADEYVASGTLQYMLRERRAGYAVPAWEVAIDAILDQHAPARLAYTGRLDINHLTKEGFYVTKRLQPYFPVLSALVSDGCSPRNQIFMCWFNSPTEEVSTSSDSKSSTSITQVRPPTAKDDSANTTDTSDSFCITDDPYLRSYLDRVRVRIKNASCSPSEAEQAKRCVAVAVRQRAEILAQFVAEQLCGLTQERDCATHTVDVHLGELELALQSRALPLGYVRVGGGLERALLFKVLADRLAVPCALVRGACAGAWCELAIPEVEQDCVEEELPAFLLRVNYVVDLMEEPGRMFRMGTHEARRVMGAIRDSESYCITSKFRGELGTNGFANKQRQQAA